MHPGSTIPIRLSKRRDSRSPALPVVGSGQAASGCSDPAPQPVCTHLLSLPPTHSGEQSCFLFFPKDTAKSQAPASVSLPASLLIIHHVVLSSLMLIPPPTHTYTLVKISTCTKASLSSPTYRGGHHCVSQPSSTILSSLGAFQPWMASLDTVISVLRKAFLPGFF